MSLIIGLYLIGVMAGIAISNGRAYEEIKEIYRLQYPSAARISKIIEIRKGRVRNSLKHGLAWPWFVVYTVYWIIKAIALESGSWIKENW